MAGARDDGTEALTTRQIDTDGCVLRVLDGPDRGRECDLPSGTITVGSNKSCELCLADPAVSGSHVRIDIVADGIRVTDLGSTNGTYYLETRLDQAVVAIGAVITVGRTRVRVASREPDVGPGYSERDHYGDLLGSAPAMRKLYAQLERIEPVDYSVLIQGPTGSGKELVAREIHRHSRRSAGPMEVLDCGAIAPSLIESTLFGHVRGAFTGATTAHQGVFERADGGTVFLDEIGELPVELQPKLLRVLETGEVTPLGGGASRRTDVRAIAATHRDLTELVGDGLFRQDLYFRLRVVALEVPALRARREDIPDLVRHIATEVSRGDVEISPATIELFTSGYDWPGNVRELRNAISSVVALGSVPEGIGGERRDAPPPEFSADEPFHDAKRRLVDAFERDYFRTQLNRADNNIAQAARLAGVDRSYFRRMLDRHGLLEEVQKRKGAAD
jgi:DNA-binding NtrC family response regulator